MIKILLQCANYYGHDYGLCLCRSKPRMTVKLKALRESSLTGEREYLLSIEVFRNETQCLNVSLHTMLLYVVFQH